MKSLKRTLCLVLALVMVLGMFGIASATNFTDDNDVQYKEAVDVMTGVGAINGMGDGTFNPKGTITRAAAAKLVTYAVLGQATAEKLTGVTSSFTDVTVDGGFGWAIPSIEYLVKAGVINGRGDGTFDPNGNISGTATLKMLLCALGYGKKSEYVGDGWDFQVTLDANKLGLTAGRTSTASVDAAATREEVALYCFNTIQKQKVEYISTLDIYTKKEIATDVPETIQNTVYGGTGALTKDATQTTDAYGRPANVWTYKGETICTAPQKAVLTYTTELKAADFELAVKNAGYKLDATVYDETSKKDVPVLEGYFLNNMDATAAVATTVGGKGILTEVFANDAKAVTKVVMTRTNLTEVADYGEDKAATTTVDERSLKVVAAVDPKTGDPVAYATVTAEDKVEGFDTVYAVAKVMNDSGKTLPVLAVFDLTGNDGKTPPTKVLSLSVPQSADVKVTSTKGDTSFVADGKTYEFGAGKADVSAVKVGDTVTIAIDKYGYVVGAKAVESSSTVGVLVDWGTTGGDFVANANYQVKLIGLDGKEVVVPVSAIDKTAVENLDALEALENSIVSYAPDAKNEGKFILTQVGPFSEIKTDSAAAFTITTGNVTVGDKVANDETVFIVKDEDGKYNVYVGIKNVPSLEVAKPTDANDGRGYAICPSKTDADIAAVVYVTGGETTGSGTQNVAFIAVDRDGGVVTTAKGTVYEAAIIDKSGVKAIYIDEATADDAEFVPVVTGYTLNSDGTVITKTTGLKKIGEADTGNVLGANLDETGKAGLGISKANKGNVTFTVVNPDSKGDDDKTLALPRSTASDCAVWIIDPDATDDASKFQLKSVANIAADTNDMVFWIEDAESTVVSAIYIVKVADKAEEGGKPAETKYSITLSGNGASVVVDKSAEGDGKLGKYTVAVTKATDLAKGDSVTVNVTVNTAPEADTGASVALSGSNVPTVAAQKVAKDSTTALTFTFKMPENDITGLTVTVTAATE